MRIIMIFFAGLILWFFFISDLREPPNRDWKQTSVYKKSEPTELFFEPSGESRNRNWVSRPDCCPEKSPVMHGSSFSEKQYSYNLRPLNVLASVPENAIRQIRKPYKVHAKEIWDLMSLEVLLPHFEGKTSLTASRFASREDRDIVDIRLGFLAGENDVQHLRARIADGRMIDVTKPADRAMQLFAYRPMSRKVDDETIIDYLGDADAFVSLVGNPIVISCSSWPSLGEETQRCQTHLLFPQHLWPSQMKEKFGGTEGLQVVYSFHKSHLADWPELIRRINTYTMSLLPELSVD